ncbi:MAG: hypothetical protein IBJ13_15860, partial [Sphingopyxis sp.]|nr:hypothetical protein [Sphingopyxis sp.]
MGKKELFGSPLNSGSLNLDCKIKLIVSDEEFGRSAFTERDYPDLTFELVSVGASDPVTSEQVGDAELLVVELDCEAPASMRRLTALRSQYGNLPLIVAMRAGDLSTTRMLLRQGVDDVIALPIQPAEFVDAVTNLLASRIKPI